MEVFRGESVRRWHGGTKGMIMGTCGRRDESLTNFEVKLQPLEVCSARPSFGNFEKDEKFEKIILE